MTNSRGEGRHRNFSGVPGFGQPAGARVPPRVGEMRRYLAVGLDAYLCLITAGLLARPHLDTATAAEAAGLLLGPALGFSFLNHVVLTALAGAGAGKLLMGIRVVRMPDAGRPGPWTLVRRWLYGLSWTLLQPWYGLCSLFKGTGKGTGARAAGADTGPGPGPGVGAGPGARAGRNVLGRADPLGVRQVRRTDLATYRAATAAYR
ncbi:RDD family protein [Streptomyces sp. NPDC015144]|uniref:RDD family protein n=1 Tax=Streptomyces sp. NPDC015144 TaxID=3364944 RepID=UPI0036FC7F4F